MNAALTFMQQALARDRATIERIAAERHPAHCLCISCAPISYPTRSPTLNHLLAGGGHLALAHAFDRAHRTRMQKVNQQRLLEQCGVRLEGERG